MKDELGGKIVTEFVVVTPKNIVLLNGCDIKQ